MNAIIRTTTSFDSYWISSVGLQVDVNAANLSPILKTVDKNFADIGDTLTYSISFKNGGLVESFNTVLIDTIPVGTSFISGTAKINGTPISITNPQFGIPIGTVPAGSTFTISFNALVTTLPSPNPMLNKAQVAYDYKSGAGIETIHDIISSNTVATTVNHIDLSLSKAVNKAFATIGDILTYTIAINTYGNTTATNLLFSDTIPNGTTLIPNTLKQDNTLISGSPNPPGITLPFSINPNKVSTVTFNVQVVTLPTPNPIPNTSTIIYSYTIDSSTIPTRLATNNQNSNTVNTQINFASLENSTKSSDKSFANCSDSITYVITIPNNGNVTAQNVFFKDTIPQGTTLLPNTLYVNGILQSNFSSTIDITLPNISPGGFCTLSFSVQILCT